MPHYGDIFCHIVTLNYIIAERCDITAQKSTLKPVIKPWY